jgi:uncharacterized protein (TIGR02246 family)
MEMCMKAESFAETTVRDIVDRMIEAWNRHDGAGFAAPFSENADFVAFEGTHLKGRAQIEEFHQQLFANELKGTRLEGGVNFVRFLGPALAVMHSWSTTTLPGQTNASPSRDSMQLFVLVKRGDDWICEALLNARRISMEQQLFADHFEQLSPGDRSDLTHRVSGMRH